MTTRHVLPPTNTVDPEHTLDLDCHCWPTVLETDDVTRVIHHRPDGEPAVPVPKPLAEAYDADQHFEGGRHG